MIWSYIGFISTQCQFIQILMIVLFPSAGQFADSSCRCIELSYRDQLSIYYFYNIYLVIDAIHIFQLESITLTFFLVQLIFPQDLYPITKQRGSGSGCIFQKWFYQDCRCFGWDLKGQFLCVFFRKYFKFLQKQLMRLPFLSCQIIYPSQLSYLLTYDYFFLFLLLYFCFYFYSCLSYWLSFLLWGYVISVDWVYSVERYQYQDQELQF